MKPVIRVENLSKSYNINHKDRASYSTLKDDFAKAIKRPFQKDESDSKELFWALKDVSFEVNAGEVFGIIGRNGSGKSTLLKILSRIAEPTKGKAVLDGRTASLLEVGTGFHPELTGRENIFFNGSMLGMSRQEINKKFNEIVEFSEVEKFIDTPVKFYSSGMYVRLAFSVAAYLEPDILILDEVLAVGDAAFQQKSLRKILSTMEEGRTVIFVSHSMGSVRQLCSRGLLLRNGQVAFMGNTEELIEKYMEVMEEEAPITNVRTQWNNDGSVQNNFFVPDKLFLTNSSGAKIDKPAPNDKDYFVNIQATVKEESELLTIGIGVFNANRTLMFLSFPTDTLKDSWQKLSKGKCTLRVKLPKHTLNSGDYTISLVGGMHNKFWLFEPGTKTPSIEFIISGGLSKSPYWKQPREGLLAPILEWEIESK